MKNFFSSMYLSKNSPELRSKIILFLFLSVFWFISDIGFVLLFQAYLGKLGVLNQYNSKYLFEFKAIHLLSICLMVGSSRAILASIRAHTSNIIYQVYLKDNRLKILDFSLKNISSKRTFETNALFNEVIFQGGSFWQQAPILLSNIIIIILLGTYAFFQFGFHFIICTSLVVLFYLVSIKIIKKFVKPHADVTEASFKISRFLTESMRNSFFFSVYRMIGVLIIESDKILNSYQSLYSKFSKYTALKSLLPQLIGLVTVLLYSHYLISINELEIGMFLAFFYTFLRLAQQSSEILTSYHLCQMTFFANKRINEWLIHMSDIGIDPVKVRNPITFSNDLKLEIKNLSFGYDLGIRILNDFNVNLSSGDILVVDGASGAGKSTLISLVMGLNLKYEGEIKYRGSDLKFLGNEFSSELAYVGPEAFFVEDTLRANLLMGNSLAFNIKDEEIENALRQCSIIDEVSEIGKGLNMILSESVQFSTGQKQRLSLARALLRRPKLLILDEATANIDKYNESIILKTIKEYSVNCMTVIVSHKGAMTSIGSKYIELGKKYEK